MLTSLLTSLSITGTILTGAIMPPTTDIIIPVLPKTQAPVEISTPKTRPIIQNWKKRLKNKDAKIDTFVSKSISLTDVNYEPTDLVSVGGISEIAEAGRVNKIRKVARDSLWDMARDFSAHF